MHLLMGSTYDMLLECMDLVLEWRGKLYIQLDMHYKYQPFCTKMNIFNLYYSNFGKFAPFIYYLQCCKLI